MRKGYDPKKTELEVIHRKYPDSPVVVKGDIGEVDGYYTYRDTSDRSYYIPREVVDEELVHLMDKYKVKALVLNLERRLDRYTAFCERTETIPFAITRFLGVDGQSMKLTEDVRKMFDNNDFGNRRSFIATALSHLSMWKELVESENSAYLIFEDDSEIDEHFNVKLYRLLRGIYESDTKYDLYYFGHHMRSVYENKKRDARCDKPGFKFQNIFVPNDIVNESIGGLFGYLIFKSGAKTLCDIAQEHGVKHGVDYFAMTNCPKVKTVYLEPHIVFSEVVGYNKNCDSDIQYDHEKLWT